MPILRRGWSRIVIGPHQIRAIAVCLLLSGAALAAQLGRIAETRVAAKVPFAVAIGPGKLGQLRGLEFDSKGRAPANMAEVSRTALAGAPLAYEPFFGAAIGGFQGGNQAGTARDAVLLNEALRRNPRSREARILLMRHAAGSGDLRAAIDHMAVLNRLSGVAIAQLMDALGKAISNDNQVDEAVAALKPHPELYRPFLSGFRSAKKPGSLAVRLVQQLPDHAIADPQARADAIALMIAARAFGQARRLWAGGKMPGPNDLIYSPDFALTIPPPPFNWELAENSTGVAERIPGGGISTRYYGRAPGPVARQLVTLAPGGYKASIDYRTIGGTPGVMALQIRCAGSDLPLGEIKLEGVNGSDKVSSFGFTVPAEDCAGQMLALVGRAGPTRDPQELTVRSISLAKGDER